MRVKLVPPEAYDGVVVDEAPDVVVFTRPEHVGRDAVIRQLMAGVSVIDGGFWDADPDALAAFYCTARVRGVHYIPVATWDNDNRAATLTDVAARSAWRSPACVLRPTAGTVEVGEDSPARWRTYALDPALALYGATWRDHLATFQRPIMLRRELTRDEAETAHAVHRALRAALVGELAHPTPVPHTRRVYDDTTPLRCRDLYAAQRTKMTLTKATELTERYCRGGLGRLTMWEALCRLRELNDQSDPDTELPNDAHALQTAAMLERDGHPEALVATGLIHDVGKILCDWGAPADGTTHDTQWAVVGDTFVAGHPLPASLPFGETLNAAHAFEPAHYAPHCGLANTVHCFGHDRYLYEVLMRNRAKHTLTPECMRIVLLHSMYPWHRHGAYLELEDADDRALKPYVALFSTYDLYSKTPELVESWDDPKWRALVERVFGTEPYDW